MKILGIESSCDETAAGIVEDGKTLLANAIQTQIDIHSEYGGVVPEIAARSHIEAVNPVIREAFRQSGLGWDDIDAIAVANTPGLVGSLLVGTLAARTLAITKKKPLYPVHHVEGHVYANFITEQSDNFSLPLPSRQPEFPMLALAVSGLHSQLILFKNHGDYRLIGQTLDDAVGEAFDKVARILGLSYPGGPAIARAAERGDPHKYTLPKARLADPYSFSFSGLKTAVLRAVQREVGVDHTFPSFELSGRLDEQAKAHFAASFQQTAIETLVDATQKAHQEFSPRSVVIAGGVAANSELRRQLSERLPLSIEYAPINLCTDNGVMIACLGYYYAQQNQPANPYSLETLPNSSMAQTAWRSR